MKKNFYGAKNEGKTMGSTTDCMPNKATLDSLSRRSNNIYKGLLRKSQLLLMIKIFLMSVRQYYQVKQITHRSRKMLAKCPEGREHIDECLARIKPPIIALRDDHLELFNKVPENIPRYNKIYRASMYFLDGTLFLLDELVEDCEVGSDKELRGLVAQLAEKC